MKHVILHYCYVCREREGSKPDGRCVECREAGREFISWDTIPEKLKALTEDLAGAAGVIEQAGKRENP